MPLINQQDYSTYYRSKNTAWERSNFKQLLSLGAVNFTGAALLWALNHLTQKQLLHFQHASSLFIESSQLSSFLVDLTGFRDMLLENLLTNNSEYDKKV